MDSAPATFFTIPELVAELAALLPRHDAVALAHSSRSLYAMCSPVIFRTLDMSKDRKLERLLLDNVAMETVSHQFQHVRSLHTSSTFLGCYLRSLALRASPSDTPAWLPFPTLNLITANADAIADANEQISTFAGAQAAATEDPLSGLPILSNLMTFCCRDMLVYEWLQRFYKVPTVPWRHLILQTAWLVSLNPQLTTITIERMTVRTTEELYRLSQALTGLAKLHELRLGPIPVSHDGQGVALLNSFLDSLPSSMAILSMSHTITNIQPQDNLDWSRRDGALHHLKELHLDIPAHFPARFLDHMFMSCPSLEAFFIGRAPAQTSRATTAAVINGINGHCPDFKRFSLKEAFNAGTRNDGFKILRSLKPRMLTRLDFGLLQDKKSLKRAEKGILRQAESLEAICFDDCLTMTSSTIRRITSACTALKILRVEQRSGVLKKVKLNRIVKERWACRNLSYLELAIAATTFKDMTFYQDSGDYYKPRKFDQELWKHWEIFYNQLGQLTQLQVLILKRAVSLEEPGSQDATFPGMLSLGNSDNGRPGYLHYLRRLVNLKELHGPFHLAIPEMAATFGIEEVQFIISKWPKLATIVLLKAGLVTTREGLGNVRDSRVGLYDIFADEWLKSGLQDFQDSLSTMSEEDREAFWKLESVFISAAMEFLKELLTAIFKNQNGEPVVTFGECKD
ncbi:hypothetical protein BGZ95_005036 [Linnemannia exigua]|uniref:Uncharacterized protein n=1 Tax=Linnemannia exigua TaxID=604196 RepID=A0AAD4DJ86_9FUNG|nr:hypothetical protein BGZ95_005036 [Linnemannia exigua]